MKYLHEVGAVIDSHKNILKIFEGGVGSVNFPPEFIWNLHKSSLGIIFAFVHIHPPNMPTLSGIDEEMIRGWSYALAPFPIRSIVISEINRGEGYIEFKEKSYFANLESKEEWEERGKVGKRVFELVEETTEEKTFFEDTNISYQSILINKSYRDETN